MPIDINAVDLVSTGIRISGTGAVASPLEVADGAIDSAAVADGAIITSKIAALAVTTGKLSDLSVTTTKLASQAVTNNKIGDSQVSLSKLAPGTPDAYIGFDGSGNPAELTAPPGAGDSWSWYDLGNNAWVIADGAGVTFAKDTVAGEATFTIPDGVDIKGGGWLAPASDTDSNQDLFLKLVYEGTRSFNQGIATARKPNVELTNGKASISRGNPSFTTNTVQTAITAVGTNDIEILISDAGNEYPDLLVTFNIP